MTKQRRWLFGQRLRRIRDQRGWNQEELAARLGVDQSTLSNWENGTKFPEFQSLQRIVEELGVSPWEVLDLKAQPSADEDLHRRLGSRSSRDLYSNLDRLIASGDRDLLRSLKTILGSLRAKLPG